MKTNVALAELGSGLNKYNLEDYGFTVEKGNYDDVYMEAFNKFIKPLYPVCNKEFYVVFKPLNRAYVPDWFKTNSLRKLMDWARQKFKPTAMVLTREYRGCAKVHINLLCTTSEDITKFHEKIILNKWMLYVKEVDSNADRVLSYMYKDAKTYSFYDHVDYVIYRTDKPTKGPLTRSLQTVEPLKFDYESVEF